MSEKKKQKCCVTNGREEQCKSATVDSIITCFVVKNNFVTGLVTGSEKSLNITDFVISCQAKLKSKFVTSLENCPSFFRWHISF